MRRVVVTGMGCCSPLGSSWQAIRQCLLAKQTGVTLAPELGEIKGMRTRLTANVPNAAAIIEDYQTKHLGMGRVAALAAFAADKAVTMANIGSLLEDSRTGLFFGSTSASPPALEVLGQAVDVHKNLEATDPLLIPRLASNTTSLNLAWYLGTRGPVQATCSACTSGSQAIGFAYEAVKYGLVDRAVAGGAEEHHAICHAVFDIMHATSTRHGEPIAAPRPFDRDRDGLVVGEGAAALVLEPLELALARGAEILGEVAGFATNCDGRHMVNPCPDSMRRVQEMALADAKLPTDAIDYVNAHGTATEVGDIAESQATSGLFGEQMPISSLKSYMGHTLGACGAIEAFILIHLLKENWLPPTINLNHIDARCARLDYLKDVREMRLTHALSNNFAFGGVNTALVFKQV